MKKFILPIIFLSGITAGFGQHALVSVYAETTVAGPEYGIAAAFESKGAWTFGAFMQRGAANYEERTVDQTFCGAELRAPLMRSERLALLATLRAGLVNEKFVAIAPGFETRMTVLPRLVVSAGGAMRKGYPSLYARVGMRIF